MSQPDIPQSRYGRERLCPHCGTRVAQRAQTCLFCGASLEDRPRLRVSIPWADIVLFSVIGGVIILWWMRTPATTGEGSMSLSAQRRATSIMALATANEAEVALALDLPTGTPIPSLVTSEPTSTSQPTQGPLPTPVRHIVKKGETLVQIVALYGATVKDVIEANGLGADGFVRAGQELLVPVAGPSGGPGPTASPKSGTLVYTIEAGDTLLGIASRFGSQLDWILSANKMQAGDVIHIGQSLLVPLAETTPTPTLTPVAPPSPTPTTGPRYGAPILLSPADGAIVTGQDEILLTWASLGVLGQDEWYVVTVNAVDQDRPIPPVWTRATTWRLPIQYRAASSAGTEFNWSVQVRSGTADRPSQVESPPSLQRRFTWK